MKLLTDFQDYYDELLIQSGEDEEGDRVYRRQLGDADGKFEELKFLRSIGIETIDIKPVVRMVNIHNLVVYTNPKKHMGEGKQVMTLSDAYEMYYNSICSEYYAGNDKTYKFLQVGFKRFSLVLKNEGLRESEVISMTALPDGRMDGIEHPIYSIDYVNKDGRLVACDFNKVQRLQHLGLEKYIPSALIVNELNKLIK